MTSPTEDANAELRKQLGPVPKGAVEPNDGGDGAASRERMTAEEMRSFAREAEHVEREEVVQGRAVGLVAGLVAGAVLGFMLTWAYAGAARFADAPPPRVVTRTLVRELPPPPLDSLVGERVRPGEWLVLFRCPGAALLTEDTLGSVVVVEAGDEPVLGCSPF